MLWMLARLAVVVLLSLHIGTAAASITYLPRPLRDSIADAPIVAHVRIKEVRDQRFRDGNRSFSCGRDYTVEVLTTFKGKPRGQRTFSVLGEPHAVIYHEVKPGDELLVMLTARRMRDSPSSEPVDVIYPAPTRAEIECRSRLSLFTLLDDASGFPLIARPITISSGRTETVWIAYSSVRTEMPRLLQQDRVLYDQNCSGLSCTQPVRVMLPWVAVEAEIQRWLREAK